MNADRDDQSVIVGVGAAVPIAVGALLVIVRDHVVGANLALILMGVVVLIAASGGRRAGAIAAITAALSFDFFLTKPYLTLRISDSDDVETTIILLIVGVAVGQFADWSRSGRHAASVARSELGRIERVAQMVSQGTAPRDIVAKAEAEITELLGLQQCRFAEGASDRALPRLERTGVVHYADAESPVVHRYTRSGFELPDGGVELPVFHRGDEVGRFVLTATPGVGISLEQRVVALALADQVGAVLAS